MIIKKILCQDNGQSIIKPAMINPSAPKLVPNHLLKHSCPPDSVPTASAEPRGQFERKNQDGEAQQEPTEGEYAHNFKIHRHGLSSLLFLVAQFLSVALDHEPIIVVVHSGPPLKDARGE